MVLFLIAIAMILPAAAWWGFVAHELWAWFVVPLGVTGIGVWQAAGLGVIVRFLTFDDPLRADHELKAEEQVVRSIAVAIIVPAVVLGFGALYHALM